MACKFTTFISLIKIFFLIFARQNLYFVCFYIMNIDFDWIAEHKNDDTSKLRLKYGKDHAFDILQIECLRKYSGKLGGLVDILGSFVFPSALAGEQSTSWALALYHAGLIKEGSLVADLTGGLGVDAFAMALTKKAKVTAVELAPETAEALKANSSNIDDFTVINADCRDLIHDWLQEGKRFDYVFIDPYRRAVDGSRVFALNDCEPDVVSLMPDLLKLAPTVIVKASPMLDIAHSLAELPQIHKIIVLGTSTECKELDFVCSPQDREAENLEAVTILGDTGINFAFTREQEQNAVADLGSPREGGFVFEPFPAVMKSGAFKLLSERFGLKKASANSHVWFADEVNPQAPGRWFQIREILPYMSKHIKRYAARIPKICVTTRNFDMDAAALKAKLKVKDGRGRLFATTLANGQKILITTEPIQA